MLVTLAWRNIWRNRRRTLITMASIVFAVVLCVLMNSIKKGLLDRMKENVVSLYSGYAQIHKNGYWDKRTLENTFVHQPDLVKTVSQYAEIKNLIPRLESFTLAASDDYAKGSMIVGIDPSAEASVTKLHDKVKAGSYLQADDEAVLVSEGLAEYLKLNVNDTIIILGQGYQGVNAVGKYEIKGLLKFGSPELNKGLIYIPLKESQKLFGAYNRLSAFVLMLDNIDKSQVVSNRLAARLGSEYEVMSWQTMAPELDQFIESEQRENIVFQAVLYMLIAFGIFGTILMMTLEREREFGILTAIGMRKFPLSMMVVMENLMISLGGAFGGFLLSMPVVYYFFKYPIRLTGTLAEAYENFGLEPIFYFSIEPIVFYTQALIVMVLASVLSFYPILKIRRLKPVVAMRK